MQRHTPETQNILGRVFGNKQDSEDFLLDSIYIIMRKFHCLDINIVKSLPLPTYFMLLRLINKEGKENERQMRKGAKR